MINVAVLSGGRSPEHGISLLSAEQVVLNLDRSRWRAWYDDHLWGNHLHECALLGTKVVPFLIPGVNRFFQRRLFNRRTERVDRSDRVFNFPIRIKQWVMEYAIDMEKTRKVLERLRELIEREGFRVHMPVEVRFSQPDDAWLGTGMAYRPVELLNQNKFRVRVGATRAIGYSEARQAVVSGRKIVINDSQRW